MSEQKVGNTRSARPRKRATSKRPPASKSAAPASSRSVAPRVRSFARDHRTVFWGSVAALGTVAVAAVALLFGFGSRHPSTGSVVDVEWPADLDSVGAAAKLAELGLVDSPDTMAIFLRATGGTSDFVPGPHLLFRGATPWELRRMLARSILRPTARVAIPEGFNRFDIGARLEKLHVATKRAFLAASSDGATLEELGLAPKGDGTTTPARPESAEGFLFPATYDFPIDSDPRDILKRLVAEANRRWDAMSEANRAGLESLKASLGWGRLEVLTLASMIEKEAVVDDERKIIASVFVNRLLDPSFHPKRLQSDPTGMYGCLVAPADAPSCEGFNGKPSAAINHDPKNRWSTYARDGLPPGPIANPGARSIEAAMAPAATHYLYFVAQGGGRHTFSETLDAHNQAVHKPK